ncbi:hypothetical protein ACUZ0H_005312, partial [Escherichia coli]
RQNYPGDVNATIFDHCIQIKAQIIYQQRHPEYTGILSVSEHTRAKNPPNSGECQRGIMYIGYYNEHVSGIPRRMFTWWHERPGNVLF